MTKLSELFKTSLSSIFSYLKKVKKYTFLNVTREYRQSNKYLISSVRMSWMEFEQIVICGMNIHISASYFKRQCKLFQEPVMSMQITLYYCVNANYKQTLILNGMHIMHDDVMLKRDPR